MLFRDWCDQFKSVYKDPFVGSAALDTYHYCLAHILPAFGDRNIEDIHGFEIQVFLTSLNDRPNMQDKCRKCLSEIFKFAYRNRIIDWDPMSALKFKPYTYDPTLPLSAADRKKFVSSLDGKPYRLLYLTYLYTGARREELIKPGSFVVDLQDRYCYIHGSKTPSSDRIVPLFDVLYRELVNMPDYRRYYESYNGNWVYLCLHRHLQQIGMTQYCVRSLRCTFSLMCYELGVRDTTIAAWLGHTTPKTTNLFYLNRKEIAKSLLSGVQSEIDIVNRSLLR